MQFKVEEGSILAVIVDPRRENVIYRDVSDLSVLPPEELTVLLDLSAKYSIGMKPTSSTTFIYRVLKPLGKYLRCNLARHPGELPKSFEDWLFLTHQFGLWYISNDDTKCELPSRIAKWCKGVCPWLGFLQEEGMIPLSVTWPDFRLPKEAVALEPQDREHVIGELPNQRVNHNAMYESLDKTIAGPIFWSSDAEYLDCVEVTLRERDRALGGALLHYWTNLVRDYRSGKKLLAQVSEDDWLSKEEVNWKLSRTRFLISPAHLEGHIWGLRFMYRELHTSNDPNCLSPVQLRRHPAIPKRFLKHPDATPLKALHQLSSLNKEQLALMSARNMYNRFLGVLNNTDFSVAVALLIREHPNLNPMSLSGALIVNGRGKSHLMVSDESGKVIFSVDKPRARSRKYATLSHKAAQIFRHLLRVTHPIREMLKRAGNPHWRYLFLGDRSHGVFGHPPIIRTDLLCGDGSTGGVTLSSLYPNLSDVGLVKGTVTFSKIRNTQAVLEWFDTGSIQAVAKRLGNSPRTAIQHYIPDSLILAWNERIIRRFQNTLIVLAARDEPWMLEAVDMPNLQELNKFLAQLLLDLPIGSSPIADRAHEYFGLKPGSESLTLNQTHSHLHVKLSVGSLAILLAYRSWAKNHLSQNDQMLVDSVTGVAPKYFVDLAGWIQTIAQSNEIGEKLRESFDVTRLKKIYQQAMPLLPDLIARIASLSIDSIGG